MGTKENHKQMASRERFIRNLEGRLGMVQRVEIPEKRDEFSWSASRSYHGVYIHRGDGSNYFVDILDAKGGMKGFEIEDSEFTKLSLNNRALESRETHPFRISLSSADERQIYASGVIRQCSLTDDYLDSDNPHEETSCDRRNCFIGNTGDLKKALGKRVSIMEKRRGYEKSPLITNGVYIEGKDGSHYFIKSSHATGEIRAFAICDKDITAVSPDGLKMQIQDLVLDYFTAYSSDIIWDVYGNESPVKIDHSYYLSRFLGCMTGSDLGDKG